MTMPRLAAMTDVGAVSVETLDRIQDGFCAVDRDWRIVYANRAACEICGISAETALGRFLWDCFPQPLSREIEAWLSRWIAAAGTSECEPASPVAGRRLWLCAALIRPGLTGLLFAGRHPPKPRRQTPSGNTPLASGNGGRWRRELGMGPEEQRDLLVAPDIPSARN